MPSKLVCNVLVPAWILTFGAVSLAVPPQGVAASFGLLIMGVFVIPALMLVFMRRQRPREETR
jgi:uncharacterized membrane protein